MVKCRKLSNANRYMSLALVSPPLYVSASISNARASLVAADSTVQLQLNDPTFDNNTPEIEPPTATGSSTATTIVTLTPATYSPPTAVSGGGATFGAGPAVAIPVNVWQDDGANTRASLAGDDLGLTDNFAARVEQLRRRPHWSTSSTVKLSLLISCVLLAITLQEQLQLRQRLLSSTPAAAASSTKSSSYANVDRYKDVAEHTINAAALGASIVCCLLIILIFGQLIMLIGLTFDNYLEHPTEHWLVRLMLPANVNQSTNAFNWCLINAYSLHYVFLSAAFWLLSLTLFIYQNRALVFPPTPHHHAHCECDTRHLLGHAQSAHQPLYESTSGCCRILHALLSCLLCCNCLKCSRRSGPTVADSIGSAQMHPQREPSIVINTVTSQHQIMSIPDNCGADATVWPSTLDSTSKQIKLDELVQIEPTYAIDNNDDLMDQSNFMLDLGSFCLTSIMDNDPNVDLEFESPIEDDHYMRSHACQECNSFDHNTGTSMTTIGSGLDTTAAPVAAIETPRLCPYRVIVQLQPIKLKLVHFMIISWILPLIIMLVAVKFETQSYETRDYCWMSITGGIFYSFVLPALWLLFVNTGLIIALLKHIFDTQPEECHTVRPYGNNSDSLLASHATPLFRSSVSLLPTLFINWFVSILAVESQVTASSAFMYTFALTNLTMNFIVYLFLYRQLTPNVRNHKDSMLSKVRQCVKRIVYNRRRN